VFFRYDKVNRKFSFLPFSVGVIQYVRAGLSEKDATNIGVIVLGKLHVSNLILLCVCAVLCIILGVFLYICI